jgi:hypothetical protein
MLRYLAIIDLDPPELWARCGLVFGHGIDDLDCYQDARIAVSDGCLAVLVRYRGAGRGTYVLVDDRSDLAEAERLVLDALSLSESDLSWRAREVGSGDAS